jgi:xylan 1,4-beta-xylosidase
MGRETGIAKVEWREDDWLYLTGGGMAPALTEVPPVVAEPRPVVATETNFDGADLPEDFQWLRTPYPDRIFQLTGSALRLIGRESIGSWFEQSLVARRQEHAVYRAKTTITEFTPTTYQQAAGLTTYYNRHKFHALMIAGDGKGGRLLSIQSCAGDWPDGALSFPSEVIPLSDGAVELAVSVDHASQQFYYRQAGDWLPIGPSLDASVISDEGGRGEHASFTGAFVGVVAFDQTGQGRSADVTRFRYAPEGS